MRRVLRFARLLGFFFQAKDGIGDADVTGVQTCALPISQRLAALAEATRGNEAEPIQRAAHAFKSAAATIGAHRLAQLLEGMEASARSGNVASAQGALQDGRSEALTVLDHGGMAGGGGGH